MKTLSIRELHATTGKIVRAAQKESIFVTDHGTVVAVLRAASPADMAGPFQKAIGGAQRPSAPRAIPPATSVKTAIVDLLHQRVYRQMLTENGYWTFFPLTTQIRERGIAAFETLPRHLFLRTADALHILCAKKQGFKTLYSNDAHLLAAAPHFGIKGINVIQKG